MASVGAPATFFTSKTNHELVPQPEEIAQHRQENYKVTLNVGGKKYEVLWATLEAHPDTRLGRLACADTHADILAHCDGYSVEENEYFFDRNPRSVQALVQCLPFRIQLFNKNIFAGDSNQS